MSNKHTLLDLLKHHVSGAIERGEKTVIVAETCCDNEDNHVDGELVVCSDCKEWTNTIECKECGETLFGSACCG